MEALQRCNRYIMKKTAFRLDAQELFETHCESATRVHLVSV